MSVTGVARRRVRAECGSVTAEAAIVLPIMAVFALALVWLISLGIAEVRAVDAARDAAREIARGGDAEQATAAAHRTAPASATVRVDRQGGLVTVLVVVPSQPPGWLLPTAPRFDLRASATVSVEGESGP